MISFSWQTDKKKYGPLALYNNLSTVAYTVWPTTPPHLCILLLASNLCDSLVRSQLCKLNCLENVLLVCLKPILLTLPVYFHFHHLIVLIHKEICIACSASININCPVLWSCMRVGVDHVRAFQCANYLNMSQTLHSCLDGIFLDGIF